MKRAVLIAAMVAIVTAACVTTHAIRLGAPVKRPPVPWQEVEVYLSADKVPGPYEEVALLSSTGEAMWTTEEEMWTSMRKKAGALGANAIILDAMSEPSAGAKVASMFLGVRGAERRGKALAIYIHRDHD